MPFGWLRRKRPDRGAGRFGEYRTARPIHDGRKSLVYQAKAASHPRGEVCALKVYKKDFDRTARRIRRRYNLRSEGQIGMVLNPLEGVDPRRHHVVKTLAYGNEYGTEDGSHYVVMEYVDGSNLKNLMSVGHSSLRRNRDAIAAQICEGLLHIHSKGLIHRDLCSDNVLLTKDTCVKLIDFGFAVPVGMKFEERSGTPSYMSPEQIKGGILAITSDIYSFGIVLFELYTGRLPFTSELDRARTERAIPRPRDAEIAQKHLHDPPPQPRAIAPDIPEVVEKVILQCLEKHPARRFQSLREVMMILSELGGQ